MNDTVEENSASNQERARNPTRFSQLSKMPAINEGSASKRSPKVEDGALGGAINSVDMPVAFERDLDSLAMTVLSVDENVVGQEHVAVILEVLGVSKDVAKNYGCDTVFSLAQELTKIIDYYRTRHEVRVKSASNKRKEFVRLYATGVFSGAPWILMIVFLSATGVSLWSVVPMALDYATVISLAVFMSLIVTGGVVQAGTRKFIFYIFQRNLPLAKYALKRYYAHGLLAIFATATLAFALSRFASPYGGYYDTIGIVFFVAISLLWIALGPLYALEKYKLLAAIFFGSLATVHLAMWNLGENLAYPRLTVVVLAQISGIVLGIVAASLLVAIYLYVIRTRLKAPRIRPKPPRASIFAYETAIYFAAGALYFVFILIDRLIVWSMSGPQVLWYNNTYEIGIGLALVPLAPMLGFIYVYTSKTYQAILELGSSTKCQTVAAFEKSILNFYRKGLIVIAGCAIPAMAFLPTLYGFFMRTMDPRSYFVLAVGSLANLFLAVFLLNSNLCNYLYRPKPVLTALFLGTVCNSIVGFTLSHTLGFENAVIGYLLGAILITFISTYYLLRSFRHLAFSLYTAF